MNLYFPIQPLVRDGVGGDSTTFGLLRSEGIVPRLSGKGGMQKCQ